MSTRGLALSVAVVFGAIVAAENFSGLQAKLSQSDGPGYCHYYQECALQRFFGCKGRRIREWGPKCDRIGECTRCTGGVCAGTDVACRTNWDCADVIVSCEMPEDGGFDPPADEDDMHPSGPGHDDDETDPPILVDPTSGDVDDGSEDEGDPEPPPPPDDDESKIEGHCGDGIMQPPEECDDGNLENGDSCSARCTAENREDDYCGDGVVDYPYEVCDDANYKEGDGCFRCNFEPVTDPNFTDLKGVYSNKGHCGDRVVQLPAESCDDGNNRPGDGCHRCQVEDSPYCGDGIIQREHEFCDDGNFLYDDTCYRCARGPRAPR